MAWTAPATYSVSEVVTAAKLNTHIRDNLDYLKGNSGLVSIAASIDSAGVLRATGLTSPSSGAGVELLYVSGTGYLLAYDRTAAGFRPLIMAGTTLEWDIASSPAMTIDASLNLGIGTTAPKGKVHAAGTGGVMLYLSANAVTSLQTVAAAGTVAHGATFYISDENNNGGAMNSSSGSSVTLGNSFTYVNTDTITVAVTAGGAITVQRTSGTNGAHNINMLMLGF